MKTLIENCVYRIGLKIIGFYLNWDIEVKGESFIPLKAIIVSDHVSRMDALILAIGLKRKIAFLSRSFGCGIPPLPNNIGQINMNKIPLRNTFDIMRKYLERGYLIGIFPSGVRNQEGQESEFKNGAFKYSYHLDAPLVPVSIKGMSKAWPEALRFPKRGQKIVLNVGEAIKNTGNICSDKRFLREVLNSLYQQY